MGGSASDSVWCETLVDHRATVTSRKTPTDRRKHPRHPISIRVRAHVGDGAATLLTADLSSGGMFLRTDDPPPPGVRLQLELSDEAGNRLRVTAKVVRSVGPGTRDPRGPGAGVQLDPLSGIEAALLDGIIEHARGVLAQGSDRSAAVRAEPSPASLRATLCDRIDAIRRQDLSEFLGLPASAPRYEVRHAYRAYVRQWHPDRFREEPRDVIDAATTLYRLLRQAYKHGEDIERADEEPTQPATPLPTPAPRGLPSVPGATDPAEPYSVIVAVSEDTESMHVGHFWMRKPGVLVLFESAQDASEVLLRLDARDVPDDVSTDNVRWAIRGVSRGFLQILRDEPHVRLMVAANVTPDGRFMMRLLPDD